MKAIVFSTLFLGLVHGPLTVEMDVAETVTAVEVHLDGEAVASLDGPPWRARLDLGEELAPHRLTAVAHDADGRELGRAEQWINLPRSRAEARLQVERRGDTAVARLVWRAVEHAAPASVRVWIDGAPLAVDDPGAIPLPAVEPDELHVVSAELTFPDGTTARADTAFGGAYGGETTSALTAVSVEVEGRRLADAGDAGPWLRVVDNGNLRPARVVAVDHGAASLYAVLDRGADRHLNHLGLQMGRRLGAERVELLDAAGEGSGAYRLFLPRATYGPLLETGLTAGDRLYLVRPTVEPSEAGYGLFGISEPLTLERGGGSAWLLTHLRHGAAGGPQRLAEAVATAGLWAAGSGRPRAVLLLLGPDAVDGSELTPRQVRRFLRRLGVPLVVAFVEQLDVTLTGGERRRRRARREAERERAERVAAARADWGAGVVDVAGFRDWVDLHRDLRRDVARQRILWVDGIHAPAAVRLEGAPDWVEPLAVETAP